MSFYGSFDLLLCQSLLSSEVSLVLFKYIFFLDHVDAWLHHISEQFRVLIAYYAYFRYHKPYDDYLVGIEQGLVFILFHVLQDLDSRTNPFQGENKNVTLVTSTPFDAGITSTSRLIHEGGHM